jgi:hypothetical protein
VKKLGWREAAELVVTALANCRSSRALLSEAVRVVGSNGGWDAVIAWTLDQRSDRYSCIATWCSHPGEMARFETAMWQVRQDREGTAVGRAAETGTIGWLSELEASSDPHLVSVTREGLTSIVVLPIRDEQGTVAVLELISRARTDQDDELEAELATIGGELARLHTGLVEAETKPRWTGGRRL